MHSGSAGHERQLIAKPAKAGFRDGLKYCKAPVEITREGRCGGFWKLKGCEHSNHRIRSMSWRDFVRSEGAVVDSFRQLPLRHISCNMLMYQENSPDIRV